MVYGIITSPTLWNLIGKPLYRDFSSPVALIDKTAASDPGKWEDYWTKTLKTMALYGLNNEDSV